MAGSSMYSGDDKSIAVTVTDPSGAAVTLTGATASWALATAPGATPLVTKTSTDGEIAIGGDDDNVVTVTLEPADTAALGGVYLHELQLVDGAAKTHTVYQGTLHVRGDIIP